MGKEEGLNIYGSRRAKGQRQGGHRGIISEYQRQQGAAVRMKPTPLTTSPQWRVISSEREAKDKVSFLWLVTEVCTDSFAHTLTVGARLCFPSTAALRPACPECQDWTSFHTWDKDRDTGLSLDIINRNQIHSDQDPARSDNSFCRLSCFLFCPSDDTLTPPGWLSACRRHTSPWHSEERWKLWVIGDARLPFPLGLFSTGGKRAAGVPCSVTCYYMT